MIGKGNPHNSGGELAAYLVEEDIDHTAELLDVRGFDFFTDLKQAFADEQLKVRNTRAEAGFFHVQWRAADGEGVNKLSHKDWADIRKRCDKLFNLEMQPSASSLHIDRITGDRHLHVAYSLVKETEDGKFYVQKLGLYKNKLKRLSREIEKDYGLRIVSNERKPGSRARAPKRREHEESNRLKTDVNAIRNTILDCYEKADSGKAFNAAMTAQGWILSNGTKRDCFVVLDQEGGHHALNKALTGKTLAQTEKRFGDLDRTQLPSVDQAKALQRDRQGEQQQTKERAADKKPLGQTASKIREAAASKDFARGLKERGLIFAYVTPEEVKASQRGKALAKAAGRQNRVLKEGFVVVDERSNVYRVDQRTTGEHWRGAQAQLAATDRSQLPSVAEARVQMKELNRAALEKKGTERKTVHTLEAEEAAIKAELAQLQRAFEAQANRTTEPVAPNVNHDAYHAGWEERLQKAAIEKEIEKDKVAGQSRQRGAEKEPDAPAAHGPYAGMRAAEPATAPTPEKPLGKTAGVIRAAYETSRTGEQLEEALAAHGIGLAVVTPEEAKQFEIPAFKQRSDGKTYEPWMMNQGGVAGLSDAHRESAERSYERWTEINPKAAAKHDFADYVQYVQGKWAEEERRPENRQSDRRPAFKEGEIVAVDGRGDVHRFNERTTGEQRPDIDARFPGINRASLLSVTDTQAVMREASLTTWKFERAAEREAARPASWTENRIAECAEQARHGGASIVRDSEGNRMTGAALVADRLDGSRAEREARLAGEPNNYQPKGQAATVHGREAFDARLEEAGISIVRVTAADTLALDALRRDEYMQRLAAETNREAYKGNRFEPLEAGELAAVTSKGDVYRINPDKLGDAKHMIPENLPSVTEARSAFKIDREKTDKLWEQWRAERAADRETTQERAGSTVRQVVRGAEKAVDKTFAAPAAAIGKAARRGGRIGESLSKAVESILRVCSLFVGEPKDTQQQAHDKAQAAGNVGTRAAENAAINKEANDTARAEQIFETNRAETQLETERKSRFGYILNQPAQPRETQRDGGRERERSRDE